MTISETLRRLVVLVVLWPHAGSLTLNASLKTYHEARGHSAVLPCHFQLHPEDSGPLDIEWNLVQPGRDPGEQLILWYTGGLIYHYDHFKGRAHFYSPEPEAGDASLQINDLREPDSGTYQCQVRKVPGVKLKRTHLVVMEKLSKPVCDIAGNAKEGERVVLRCRSSRGSAPIKYRWFKISGNTMMPQMALANGKAGEMVLGGLTARTSGTYRCSVENVVGAEQCEVELQINSPPTPTPSHVPSFVTVGSALAVAIAIVVVVALTCFAALYRRWTRPEGFGNEITMDEPPPHRWLANRKDEDKSQPSNDKGSEVENLADETEDEQNHQATPTMSLMQAEAVKKDENVYEKPLEVVRREFAGCLKESCDVRKASLVIYLCQEATPDTENVYESLDIGSEMEYQRMKNEKCVHSGGQKGFTLVSTKTSGSTSSSEVPGEPL